MSDDLVKRLRVGSIWGQSVQGILTNWGLERQEAADRIEQLVATNEELEEKILSATMDGYDMAKHEYRDRIEELVATNEELEAKLATCKKYKAAYAECDKIATQAVRDLEAKLAEVGEMKRLLAMDKINLRGELAWVEAKLAKAMQIVEAYGEDEGYVPLRVVSLYEELSGPLKG